MKITQLYKEYVIRGWWKLPSYTGIISHGKVIMFHFHLNFLESLGKSHFPSNKNATDIGRNRPVHYEGGRWKEGQRLWESSERVKIFFAPRIHGNDIVEWCIWMICFFCLRKVSKYIIQSYRSFGGWKKRKKCRDDFGLWVYREPSWNGFLFAKFVIYNDSGINKNHFENHLACILYPGSQAKTIKTKESPLELLMKQIPTSKQCHLYGKKTYSNWNVDGTVPTYWFILTLY